MRKNPISFSNALIGLVASLGLGLSLASSSSFADTQPSPLDFAEQIYCIAETRVPGSECAPHFQSIVELIQSASPTRLNMAEVDRDYRLVLSRLFSARLEIRRQARSLYLSNQYSPSCANSIKSALRMIRGSEDYIGYVAGSHGVALVLNGGLKPQGLTQTALVNDEEGLAFAELRSGDILLTRSTAQTSAAIARLADQDTQISDIAMVHITVDQKVFVLQSKIESGLTFTSYANFLSDRKIRTAIYRFEGQALASEASRMLYDRAVRQTAAAPVLYDFKMISDQHSELYAAEAIREAFEMASQSQLVLPLTESRFDMRNTHFLGQLGISAEHAFMPGDIETDHRFQLVAEDRDFSQIRNSWRNDAILTAIYNWMETSDYLFYPSNKNIRKGNRLYKLRQSSLFSGFVQKKVPANASAQIITSILTLNQTVEAISKALQKIEAPYEHNFAVTPSPLELAPMLSTLRNQDYKQYQIWLQSKKKADRPVFHLQIH